MEQDVARGDDHARVPLIELVKEDMTVYDAAGEKLGDVEYVQMGDPQAITTEGNEWRDTGLLGDVAKAFGAETEPDVPEPFRSRLIRTGFIKVDGPGLFDRDRYVPATRIARVSDDEVRLSVTRAQIPEENDDTTR